MWLVHLFLFVLAVLFLIGVGLAFIVAIFGGGGDNK